MAQKLTGEARQTALAKLSGWSEVSGRDAIVKKFDRSYIQNYGDRFRFQTLQSRYATFIDLWDRGLKAREEGRPAAEDLRKAIAQVQLAANNLDAMITDARPGVQNFSKSTLPEAGRLVHDLRDLSQSLKSVSELVNQQGIGGALGPEKLPDYKPRKR